MWKGFETRCFSDAVWVIFQDRRRRRSQAGNLDGEAQGETSDTEKSDNPDFKSDGRKNRRS